MSIRIQIKLYLSWLASVYLLAAGTTVSAAEMVLSSSPLFLGTQVPPNVFFMLDDSGSMDWEVLTSDYEYYTDYWSSSSTFGTVDITLFPLRQRETLRGPPPCAPRGRAASCAGRS